MSEGLAVALELPRTEAEGPGLRYAVWLQGCSLRCPGCCNPEYLSPPSATHPRVEAEDLAARVLGTPGIEGLSVLGGEPMEQAGPLAELLQRVRAGGLSTMVFTGYRREELSGPALAALDHVDLLVDGRYERSEPELSRRWIGSRNQRMLFLTDRYDPADPRFVESDTVELRFDGRALTVNGRPWGTWRPRRYGA